MKEIIFEVEQDAEGGFVAQAFLNETGQIITQGDTLDVLKQMIKEALECHFEDETEMPNQVRLHIVTNETFTLA